MKRKMLALTGAAVGLTTLSLVMAQNAANQSDTSPATQPATQPAEQEQAPEGLESYGAQVSYLFGQQIGRNLATQVGEDLDQDALIRGLRDGIEGKEPPMSDEQMQQVMMRFQQEMMIKQQEQMGAFMEQQQAQAQAFLEQNKEKEGVQTTESGLQYEVLEEGEGETPDRDDAVRIHYRGTLPDGTEFDSSHQHGEPAEFAVGGVIAGMTEALLMMQEGAKWTVYIPPDLGYPQGTRTIPPQSVLIFELELLDVLEQEDVEEDAGGVQENVREEVIEIE